MIETAVYQITGQCGNECLYCLNEKGCMGKKPSLDSQKKVIDTIKEYGAKYLVISGGEPLEDENFTEIVEHAFSKGFLSLVQTNALKLDKKAARKIKGKVIGLEVSLEGLSKEHNKMQGKETFWKVLDNIKLARDEGIPVFTNFTITKINYSCIPEYVGLLNKMGIAIANFTTLYEAGNALSNRKELAPSREEYRKMLEDLEKMQEKSHTILNVQGPVPGGLMEGLDIKYHSQCNAGNEITVKPDGRITVCPAWGKELGQVGTDKKGLEKKLKDIRKKVEGCDGCPMNAAQKKD